MITQALAATNGAKVYITSRGKEALNKVVEQYHKGAKSKGIHLLVSNTGIARVDKTRFDKAGKPDWSSAKASYEHFMQSEQEQWADTFRTNVTAQSFTTMAFLPLLEKGRNLSPGYTSSVVNIASISGVMNGTSGGQFAYAIFKVESIQPTRMMATTLVEAKIRVNCIASGSFPSEMTAGASGEDQSPSSM
ncbi:MAG: hypothetical protein ALECFALPRED_004854 [Alectoria fallacina]|uniref:Uncharacterized protein n=1 Tax=Alectoria fallacina TaxID=1903189 RepID=A0A8H3I8C7_9LECA|nr:MAG: hypothetical protein ALECFALPRED_004854 [Alectoria fallacina]